MTRLNEVATTDLMRKYSNLLVESEQPKNYFLDAYYAKGLTESTSDRISTKSKMIVAECNNIIKFARTTPMPRKVRDTFILESLRGIELINRGLLNETQLNELGGGLWGGVKGLFGAGANKVKQGAQAAGKAIGNAATTGVQAAQGAYNTANDKFQGAQQAVGDKLTAGANVVKGAVSNAANTAANTVNNGVQAVKGAYNAANDKFQGAQQAAGQAIQGAYNAADDKFQGAQQAAGQAIGAGVDKVKQGAQAAGKAVKNAATVGANKETAKSAISEIDQIGEFLGSINAAYGAGALDAMTFGQVKEILQGIQQNGGAQEE